MSRSDQRIIRRQMIDHIGQHYTDLHNAVQNLTLAAPGTRSKLRHGIRFHLEKVVEHKSEPTVINGWRKRELLVKAAKLIADKKDAALIDRITEYNRLLFESNGVDYSLNHGITAQRASLLAQLSGDCVFRAFPWLQ